MERNVKSLMFSLLIIFSSFTLALACGCGCTNHSANRSTETQDITGKVQCPVMKNWILPTEAADSVEYNGKTYYFCCGGCKEKFLAEPEKYTAEPSDNS